MYYKFSNPRWIKYGKKYIAVYDGLGIQECIKISEHYRRIQSMVDTYPYKFTPGLHYVLIDNSEYTILVSRKGRRIALKEVYSWKN